MYMQIGYMFQIFSDLCSAHLDPAARPVDAHAVRCSSTMHGILVTIIGRTCDCINIGHMHTTSVSSGVGFASDAV